MINDFEVPKSGYDFDSNGKERTLNLNLIKEILHKNNASVFFTSELANFELNGSRGCCEICKEISKNVILEIESLKNYSFKI